MRLILYQINTYKLDNRKLHKRVLLVLYCIFIDMIKSKKINIRITESQFQNLMEVVVKTEKSQSKVIRDLIEGLTPSHQIFTKTPKK